MSTVNGLPLLSGPPPIRSTNREENACRKCNKEFVIIFTRSTRCNHCGYMYCHSCADYLALMPRRGTASGYDQVHVCAYCIELLNITASSRNQLKSLSLSKLSHYVRAYNIHVKGPIDKNDLVDAIIAAKTQSGTLPEENENFYRVNSVPTHRPARPRGLFSSRPPPPTQQRTPTEPSEFPRPDLDSQTASYATYTSSTRQRQTSSTQFSHPPPPRFRTTSQPQTPQFRASSQPQSPHPSPPRSHPASSPPSTANTRTTTTPHTPPRPSTASTPTLTPTQVPPPPLSALLTMSPSSLSRLPVHTLKQILHDARVRLPPDVLEKGELVQRVSAWVEEERMAEEESERAEREEREQEERERLEREEQEGREQSIAAESEDVHVHDEGMGMPDESQRYHPPPPPPKTSVEKSGLCVICQDHEANIAIVDCGHLAMCRECSELVLASTRECPLCRTRIVTEARLLRIFKT